MKLALPAAAVLSLAAPAQAGKYMMGSPPSSGWGWVGRAVEAGIDMGVQATVVGSFGGQAGLHAAVELGVHVGLCRPTHSWFARPALDLDVSVARVFDPDRWQVRGGAGTSVGPITLAFMGVAEISEEAEAFAVSPELRVRHRFGTGTRKPSVGMFVRADVFMDHRDTHDDRVSLGLFGALDLF